MPVESNFAEPAIITILIMSETVSVIIPITGRAWLPLAERAKQSVQGADRVWISSANTVAEARNQGARATRSSHIIFLDADDELGPNYIEEMKAIPGGIRRPSTLGIYEDGTEDDVPVMIPRRNIYESNFIVIGAMVEREQVLRVGGFRELPALEDWDLWLRLIKDGASIVDVPRACYKVHVRPNSRNSNSQLHGQVYAEIRRTYRADSLHADPQ